MNSHSAWQDANVVVTGGASFIGSCLVDKLVEIGSRVTVVDNLSSGRIENLDKSWTKIEFINKDLEYISKEDTARIFRDKNIVFHLAAIHGGRGYITSHPADVCSNLSIDHHIFEACANSTVENVVFASTACVYPTELQSKAGSNYLLKEEDCNPFRLDGYLSADIEYGWGKLMSEIQLISFYKQYGLKGCPVRFVTAYGPRENETHAIIALIYKALAKMDPYEIWGDGNQERDFTYVDDIVEGCILAAQKIHDCTPVNLGTGRRYSIATVAEMIFRILRWRPSGVKFNKDMPVGAVSRGLDNSRARRLLGWEPRYDLEDGLERTINWYKNKHTSLSYVEKDLLTEHNVRIATKQAKVQHD